jgi:hypothetical protein
MTRMRWILSGAAVLFLGCGGDTASTSKTTKTTSTSDGTKIETTTTKTEVKRPKDAVQLPPIDVPEPPPPKAVSEKDKKAAGEEPKTPKPLDKKDK